MIQYSKYLFPLLCFLGTMQLVGQNNQLRSYTIEDGLPQSQVYDLLQDEMGYLWLGTQGGGLANFDGDIFEVWNEDNGLLSNYIHVLYVANDSLFIGSKRGLSIKVKNRFINFKSPQIKQIYSFGKRTYLATKKGVYLFSKDEKLRKVKINPEIDESTINCILYDGTHYWLATNKGLWKLSELKASVSEPTKLESNNFTSVLLHNDKILAATFDDGVFIMDSKNPKDSFLMPEPTRINSMSIQNEDELWIATDNEGIVVVETQKFSEIKKLNTTNGLAVPHVRTIIKDDLSNLWIATSGGGFYKYFQNNFKHYDKATGLKGNRIYAVHHAKDGVWISSSENGLMKIDSLGIHPIEKVTDFADVKIKTITSNTDGNIWAGSDDRGILYRETKMEDSLVFTVSNTFQINIDTISKKVTKNHVFNEENGFPSDWIRKIVITEDAIWAATYASGIVKFNFLAEQDSLVISKQFGKKEGLRDLLLNDVVEDTVGRLWYATTNGYLGYIQDDTVTTVETPLERQTAIGPLLFYENELFLGTFGKGVWHTDSSDLETLRPLKGAKNLSSTNIYQLIFDDQGYLWAGTEKGVDRIELNPASEIVDVHHFSKNDGFLSIETCLNAVDKDDKGNLWFGGIYGLTEYIPNENSRETIKPKVYFTGIEEAYKTIDSLFLKDWTNSEKVLQLTPDQTQLGFSFRTVDLDHPNEIEYRTKLDDAEWSPWVKENKQNFAGLAYGAHTFSVQSRNHRWTESDPIQFRFFIDSPLYQKDEFKWAVLAVSVLGLFGMGLFYIRKIKVKNKAAQESLQTRNYLLTLEQKALQLQMNPHFIFNVLNGIKGMAGNKPEKMNSTINSFATLLRETLYNSRKEFISLAQEIKTLNHYIAVEKLMVSRSFSYVIDVKTEPGAEEILIPPMLIQPFVENAIRHGILKGDREGKLEIGFHTTKTHLHCRIIDNGMGIYKSQNEKVKTDHQSMALKVTKERLESIAGMNTLQIEEIKNADGSIGGTKISFKIPFLTDY